MKRPLGFGAFPRAMGAALQWKLLALWFVFTLIPTLIVVRPLHAMLSGMMDHSVHAGAWARGFDGMAMSDVIAGIARHGMTALGAAFALGTMLMLLLSPFLVGMSVTAVRARQRPGFGELMHGGLHEYWRLLRFLLWALLLYALFVGVQTWIGTVVASYASKAILESKVVFWKHVADGVVIALFVIVQSMVEAGRGRIVADPGQRSATRAFFAGVATVFRRPLVTLGMYLGVTIVGTVIAFLLGEWRIHVLAVGMGGTILAVLILVLLVASMAWMRTARLAGMAAIAEASR